MNRRNIQRSLKCLTKEIVILSILTVPLSKGID